MVKRKLRLTVVGEIEESNILPKCLSPLIILYSGCENDACYWTGVLLGSVSDISNAIMHICLNKTITCELLQFEINLNRKLEMENNYDYNFWIFGM